MPECWGIVGFNEGVGNSVMLSAATLGLSAVGDEGRTGRNFLHAKFAVEQRLRV